jgi:nicotinate-nucleotide adenylyltransferase
VAQEHEDSTVPHPTFGTPLPLRGRGTGGEGPSPLRIGVLGGTFDPIHIAHLAIAEECRVRLALDLVLFVPAGLPPHKLRQPITPVHHRVAMVELAIESNPHFEMSRVDAERDGPSYTADTLALLQAELRTRGEDADLFLIIGMDSLVDIRRWYHPAEVLSRCTLAAVSRPGLEAPDLGALESVLAGASQRVVVVDGPRLDISATDLRSRVAAGLTIRYRVPEAVEQYIHAHGLYRSELEHRSE